MADWAGFPEAEGGCTTSNDKQIILNERENKWRSQKKKKERKKGELSVRNEQLKN